MYGRNRPISRTPPPRGKIEGANREREGNNGRNRLNKVPKVWLSIILHFRLVDSDLLYAL